MHCSIAIRLRYYVIPATRKCNERLHDSRTGINLTKQKLWVKDRIISPLIAQGKSPYQIITNQPELEMSLRTL